MRAVVLDRLGADAPFRVAELPSPEPGPGQVRIRVEAVGVNPVDVATRLGLVPLPRPNEFPLILGWDAAGVVDAVGDHVTQWSPGHRVMGFSAHLRTQAGTYAEHIVLDVGDIAEQPPGWSSVQAAALPSSGLTALQALEAVGVGHGDHLVVIGAVGMVGGLVTQVAVSRGALVTAVVSPPDAPLARSLGANTVVDRHDDVPTKVREATIGGADAAVCAAREVSQSSMDTVRDGGRFCTVTDMPEPSSQRGIEAVEVLVHSHTAQLRELTRLAGEGVATPRISRTLPLDEAGAAHELVQNGGLAGKVILHVG